MCNATYLGFIIQNIVTTLTQVEWRKKGLADFSLPGILNLGSKERIQWPVNLDGNGSLTIMWNLVISSTKMIGNKLQ